MSTERDKDYESRFITKEQLLELDEIREEYEKGHLIYAPNSINHGWENSGHFKDTTILKIEIARLYDFIEFLFNDKEYCDHSTQSEAWDEFEQWEYSQFLNSEQSVQESDTTDAQSSEEAGKQITDLKFETDEEWLDEAKLDDRRARQNEELI